MQIKNGETGETVNIGDIIEGKITGLTKYGAFVSAGNLTGMIHISEVSGGFVKDINEVLKIGQTVQAVVLSVNDGGKLALSIKQARVPVPSAAAAPSLIQDKEKSKDSKGNFEDMLNKFKRDSDEKMSDLKHLEPKRTGQAHSRRRKD
jgi:S1 RNA binding domain protein